ncbi:MAG TPA: TIGR03621 family F420-dependent LLM class oxidoreductase [Acidimicrobiales bacterium]|nr:TIGR03621 family F420-dependent LLM class oxidoreductase [Acidimicrobiales bacterium]
MAHPRRFRFAAQLSKAPECTASSWSAQARKAEDLGYSAILMPDHFDDQLAPVPALAAAAAATARIKIGALVFDNDYRHPLLLAKEAATLDVLSDGRLELGIGAGWMKSDYDQSGISYDPPGERVERFEEGVRVLKGLLETEGPFSFAGKHYEISDHTATPRPVQRPRPPILIGGGGKRVLSFAAREADIVGVNVNLRSGFVGQEAAADATPDATRRKVGWVRDAAGSRFDDLELNTLIGFAVITDEPEKILEPLASGFGIDAADVPHVPLALVGSVEAIEEELRWRREEYGFSYFAVQSDAWETLGPVVSHLAGT